MKESLHHSNTLEDMAGEEGGGGDSGGGGGHEGGGEGSHCLVCVFIILLRSPLLKAPSRK